MYYYQITKYNPIYRNEKGWYTKDEWTDFSCVGHEFEGVLCTVEDYEYIENLYINAVLIFMDCMHVDYLACSKLEKRRKKLNIQGILKELRILYEKICPGMRVSKQEMPALLKLILRRYLWCELIHDDKKMFVSFSHDFYMFIGVEDECKDAVEKVNKSGIFAERLKEYYFYDEEDE